MNSNEIDVKPISSYMYAGGHRWAVMAAVFIVALLILMRTGPEMLLPSVAGAALLAILARTFFNRGTQPAVRRILDQYYASGRLEELITDFNFAQEIAGVGKFGKKFFVGYNTVTVVDYTGVAKVDVYTDDFNHDVRYYLAFFIKGNEPVKICQLTGERDTRHRDRIRQLLQGRVPLGSAFDET